MKIFRRYISFRLQPRAQALNGTPSSAESRHHQTAHPTITPIASNASTTPARLSSNRRKPVA
jgi:hypothetical protein